jgi:hypothetical protein
MGTVRYPGGSYVAPNTDFDNFKAVNDGAPVTLTFHFWSGATVAYHVTKSGSSVTGSSS